MKQILLDLYHNSNISLLLVRRAHHGVETFWSFTTYRPQARENHRGAFGIVKSQISTVPLSTTLMKISSCFERAFQSRFPCFQKNTLVLTSLNFSRNLSFESALLGRYRSQLHCSCLSAGAVLEDPRRRISHIMWAMANFRVIKASMGSSCCSLRQWTNRRDFCSRFSYKASVFFAKFWIEATLILRDSRHCGE